MDNTRQKRPGPPVVENESNKRTVLTRTNLASEITALETGIRPLAYTELRTVHSHDLHTILSALAYSFRQKDPAELHTYLCKEIITTYLYHPSTSCLKAFLTACVNRVTQSFFEEGAFLEEGRILRFWKTRKSFDILRANLETNLYAGTEDLRGIFNYFSTLVFLANSPRKVRYQALYNLVIDYLADTKRVLDYMSPELSSKLETVLKDPVVIRLAEIRGVTAGMPFKKWIREITSDLPPESDTESETKVQLEYLFKGHHKPSYSQYIFTFVPFLLTREAPLKCDDLPVGSDTSELDIADFCKHPGMVFPSCIYTHIAHINLPEYQRNKHPSHAIEWDLSRLTASEKVLLDIYNFVCLFHEKDI